MRVKISNEALKRVAKKIRGQQFDLGLPKPTDYRDIEDIVKYYYDEDKQTVIEKVHEYFPDAAEEEIIDIWQQVVTRVLSAHKRAYTPDEFDDVLDQDEAHQEFMRGEEEFPEVTIEGLCGDLITAYENKESASYRSMAKGILEELAGMFNLDYLNIQ
jgi:hypothetical protein